MANGSANMGMVVLCGWWFVYTIIYNRHELMNFRRCVPAAFRNVCDGLRADVARPVHPIVHRGNSITSPLSHSSVSTPPNEYISPFGLHWTTNRVNTDTSLYA